MELFKITCVTCRARLSVRDAALIGKIIGCPKCGMMVQVTAPAGDSPQAAAPTIAVAAAIASPPQPVEDAFADVPEVAGPPAATVDAHESASVFDDAADVTAPDALAEPPTPPPAPSTIAAAASRATTYKLAALTVAGAIAGSAVVAAALSWLSHDAPTVAVAPAAKAEIRVEKPEAPAPAPVSTPSKAPDESIAPEVSEPEPEALLPIDESPDDDVAAPPTEAVPPTPAEAAPTEPAPTIVEPAEPVAEAPPVETAPEPRLRIDPLDVDPEGINLSTLYGGPPKDPLAESQLPKDDEPAPSVPQDEPEVDEAEAAPAAAQAVRRDAHAGVGAPGDAAALLARKLPAIKFNKTPLCRLLDLAVHVSGLPVSVSPEELRMAAVSAATPASVDAKDATIETMLTNALKPLRLKPVVDGEQIVLHRNGEDKRRTVDYAVDDLAATPAKVEQLGQWIRQLAAPESWQAGGEATLTIDGDKLHVEAPESVQYEVLFVLERYRVTRDLPTRTKYPASLLASGAFHASVAERLSAPAVFTFAQYTPLREIFRYWQEELDVAVLVDWPALADARLWPNARIACSATDKIWAEAMDSVLEPLGLGWRAVGRNTIEITALTKIRDESLLEVYRVAADAAVNPDELVHRVQSLAAEGAEPPAPGAVFYDVDSRVLLVRQPAAAHRKLVAEMHDLFIAPANATGH